MYGTSLDAKPQQPKLTSYNWSAIGTSDTNDRLKRSLRTEIDESAWSVLYTAESLPFDPPTTGKIAIKVINDYGDEVLPVFPVK